jgi:ABC-type lipoprotein release transport system permease subunit
VLVLTAIAMLACVVPARHAARAEPLKALRVE